VKLDDANALDQRLDALYGVVVVLARIGAEPAPSPSPLAVVHRLNDGIAERVRTSLRMPAASRND